MAVIEFAAIEALPTTTSNFHYFVLMPRGRGNGCCKASPMSAPQAKEIDRCLYCPTWGFGMAKLATQSSSLSPYMNARHRRKKAITAHAAQAASFRGLLPVVQSCSDHPFDRLEISYSAVWGAFDESVTGNK